jgi:uncharacterized protein YjbI with pentapeptide repeats
VANEEHVWRLKEGVEAWNSWRTKSEIEQPDLINADLHGANLSDANLSDANLRYADLTAANLRGANLSNAHLRGANLTDVRGAHLQGAHLQGAYLNSADLRSANLSNADLRGANLTDHADLSDANLDDADLRDAILSGANMSRANLNDAKLIRAKLSEGNLSNANLSGADLSGADLTDTTLNQANLSGTNLTKATLGHTIFADTDLSSVIGLAECKHLGPSTIDHQTLERSGSLPIAFLRGIGLPDTLIEYLPALFGKAIQYYSCFISYSTKDDEFANRLHADLQNNGVRCWFAPHDMRTGEKILDSIDQAIRLRDKVLLILSEDSIQRDSIQSEWVEDEVTKGFQEERRRRQTVLFPVRLDDAVLTTAEAWATKLTERHIGDFRRWKDHDSYKQSFDRVLRDLKRVPVE